MNKPDYKNWIPKWMFGAFTAGAVISLILLIVFALALHGAAKVILVIIFALAFLLCLVSDIWSIFAYNKFSYNGKRKLSKSIIDGIADYVDLPDGATALDIGCGSGALAIAVAKKNPNASVIGCDRWGKEYKDFQNCSVKITPKQKAAKILPSKRETQQSFRLRMRALTRLSATMYIIIFLQRTVRQFCWKPCAR